MGEEIGNNESDFSEIDTREKAMALAQEGQLFKVLLFPEELGGADVPQNIVYVPAGIPEVKDKITGTLVSYVQDGLIDQLNVAPVYKGGSFVPSKITINASHSGKSGEFNASIEIW